MPLPPLVEPAAELTAEELARYSRHLLIPELGLAGQKRLKNARVLVVGAGGLGSPSLLYLAAAGVGTLGIIDFDLVEESNLQRQIIHGQSDIGRPKAESARDAIREVNPLATVHAHIARLDRGNAVDLFSRYDLIVDGSDNFATRYLVNDAAVLAAKPYVWGSVHRFAGQASVFWEDAPDGPGGERRGLNYRDLYPHPPPPGLVPSCAEAGVLGTVCAAIASVMATEAVKIITGVGESLLGRLLIFDASEMSYRTVPIRKDPDSPPITGLVDYQEFCGAVPLADDPGADHAGITPAELRELLASGAAVALIDVREPAEWEINRIAGARHIPKSALESGGGPALLPSGEIPVLYCKTGARSAQVLAALKRAGVPEVLHLRGGIVEWARQFEPDMAMY